MGNPNGSDVQLTEQQLAAKLGKFGKQGFGSQPPELNLPPDAVRKTESDWERIYNGGDPKNFGDQLIVFAEDLGGSIGNFFAPEAVVTRSENVAKIQAAKDDQTKLDNQRLKMVTSNYERAAATGSTAGMQAGRGAVADNPQDFTTDRRVFNTNLGDKK